MSIDEIRREYDRNSLHEDCLHSSPHEQFSLWFNAALAATELIDPTAMLLATCHSDQTLSQRIVLLKHASEQGYVFYTNYNSHKSQALLQNPQCSIHFAWLPLERQISISGRAKKITAEESDTYFASRPRGSQIAAWASEQSEPIENRQSLDTQYEAVEQRFANSEHIPRPPHWGGFIIQPDHYEFWQGARARLHDRYSYSRNVQGEWLQQRLQP